MYWWQQTWLQKAWTSPIFNMLSTTTCPQILRTMVSVHNYVHVFPSELHAIMLLFYVVHRIGRTGRCGKTGIATTFINKMCGKCTSYCLIFCTGLITDGCILLFLEESVLRDLKALLIEAKQKVPPFLHQLDSLNTELLELGDDKGCAYCGGLGHRITECPKLAAIQQQEAGKIGRRDFIADSAADY